MTTKVFGFLLLFDVTSSGCTGCVYAVTFSGVWSSPKNGSFKFGLSNIEAIWLKHRCQNVTVPSKLMWCCNQSNIQSLGAWSKSQACFGDGVWFKRTPCISFPNIPLLHVKQWWSVTVERAIQLEHPGAMKYSNLAFLLSCLVGSPLLALFTLQLATLNSKTWDYSANHPHIIYLNQNETKEVCFEALVVSSLKMVWTFWKSLQDSPVVKHISYKIKSMYFLQSEVVCRSGDDPFRMRIPRPSIWMHWRPLAHWYQNPESVSSTVSCKSYVEFSFRWSITRGWTYQQP